MVGAGDRRVDVAELERHGLVHVSVVAVLVDARFVVREAVGGRRERPERLVHHVDEVDGAVGGRFVARDDGGDGIADETDFVAAQRVLVVADRQDPVRDRERVAGEHEVNAVDGRRARRVDAEDTRVGLGRTQEPAVQHARQHDVVGEARLSGHFCAGVDAPPRTSDDAGLTEAHRCVSAFVSAQRSAAASTASMICA